MSFRVRITKSARDDLGRLNAYLIAHDLATARRARHAIAKGLELLKDFPFTCRKAAPDSPFLRELLIAFGSAGYVVLFEVEETTVTVLAVRHQREDDYL
ncbi:type II toxin-antitoxin system RelE/ParE family toxin [Massilia glaciei]|uniref:Type II toxin-antitoxin system RelE/ParE family toxin n=1 Tax=Massilia glaciei TaxID=1524097 RepID=A0A2U2HH81_9BURK|nr:type II toxin-antitoxin system RelE/ParE family toxin [Massilia glaciei]PWF45001.1 type II toxin-antitoxin system RelE/ParE family toxin [Massilia glaciei]